MVDYRGLQNAFGHIFFLSYLIAAFFSFKQSTNALDYALLSATLIASFYFWWGYLILAKVHPNSRFFHFFVDFAIVIAGMGMYLQIGISNPLRAFIWMVLMLTIFIYSVIKYYATYHAAPDRAKRFFRLKIRTNTLAGAAILVLILLSPYITEIAAVWCVFSMECVHIFYVGWKGTYENLDP